MSAGLPFSKEMAMLVVQRRKTTTFRTKTEVEVGSMQYVWWRGIRATILIKSKEEMTVQHLVENHVESDGFTRPEELVAILRELLKQEPDSGKIGVLVTFDVIEVDYPVPLRLHKGKQARLAESKAGKEKA